MGSQKLSPLHYLYINLARSWPKAATYVLDLDFMLPDISLGVDTFMVHDYYSTGAEILLSLSDYDKAHHYLTIATATKSPQTYAKTLEKLLLTSLLTGYAPHGYSRHISQSTDDGLKDSFYKYSRIRSAFESESRMSKNIISYLEEFKSNGFQQEVFLILRRFRELKIMEMKKTYLTVRSSSIAEIDQGFLTAELHALRVICSDSSTPIDDHWASNAGPTGLEADNLTKEFIYYIFMSTVHFGSIEEDDERPTYIALLENQLLPLPTKILSLREKLIKVSETYSKLRCLNNKLTEAPEYKHVFSMSSNNPGNSADLTKRKVDSMKRKNGISRLGRVYHKSSLDAHDFDGTDTSGVDTVDDED